MFIDFFGEFFAAAKKFHEAKPWEKLWDTDIFGIQDPETGETFFVEVMGRLGDHIACSIFPNEDAIFQVLDAIADPNANPEFLYEIPQVQISFENRDLLTPEDYNLIKQTTVSFRGKMAWPMIREFHAGRFPSMTTDLEYLRKLELAMEQAAIIANEYNSDEEISQERYRLITEKQTFPVRRCVLENNEWVTSSVKFKREEKNVINMVSPKTSQLIEELPIEDRQIAMDFFAVPTQIEDEEGGAPFLPYCFILVDPITGNVIGQELITIKETMDEVLNSLPEKLAEFCKKAGFLPQDITVVTNRMEKVLQPFAALTGVSIDNDPDCAPINFAKYSLLNFMKGEPVE